MMKKVALTMTAVFTAAAMMVGCTSSASSTTAATETTGSEVASGESAASGSSYKIGVFTKDSTTAFWRYEMCIRDRRGTYPVGGKRCR